MTRRESADERQVRHEKQKQPTKDVLSRESSPCPPRRAAAANKRQILSRKSSPCSLRGTNVVKERSVLSGRYSPCPYRGTINKDRQVLPGRSSPYELRNKRHFSGIQDQSRRSSPYPLCNKMRSNKRPVASGRTSPYIMRAGEVETEKNRRSGVQPYKRRSKGAAQKESILSKGVDAAWINWGIAQARDRQA
ncbi:hypothetical protein TNIN_46011 [Trichonephila inaurata madagascariensis]|uniref:Uncharacterized protein n=1 Tax=Trichonephila inaurata madagascariensis TaxID=2747483 RepID=A0A8X6YNI3_9ARAC|nr:hypothetical protein TNIN_46011 [Trichonephila inaurata madagascariensis]